MKITQEQRRQGGRNSKRPPTAKTYGKRLVKAFLEVTDPTEQVALLKQYSTLPQGVELPKEIHFQLYQMNMEANRRMTDQLVMEDEKQQLSLELLQKREEVANRKLILSNQLKNMTQAQQQALYEQTIQSIRAEIRAEIEAELEAEL